MVSIISGDQPVVPVRVTERVERADLVNYRRRVLRRGGFVVRSSPVDIHGEVDVYQCTAVYR